tara:strand:+ start:55271 stop:55420 length:150 start_codon:yes stop_codon:yes gene_type:complete
LTVDACRQMVKIIHLAEKFKNGVRMGTLAAPIAFGVTGSLTAGARAISS